MFKTLPNRQIKTSADRKDGKVYTFQAASDTGRGNHCGSMGARACKQQHAANANPHTHTTQTHHTHTL